MHLIVLLVAQPVLLVTGCARTKARCLLHKAAWQSGTDLNSACKIIIIINEGVSGKNGCYLVKIEISGASCNG